MDIEPNSLQTHDSTSKKRLILIIAAVLVAVAVALLAWVLLKPADKQAGQGNASEAAATFYKTLANAAKQQKMQVSMYRATFATDADADAGKNIGTQLSSVSALDTTANQYRSVWANDLFDSPKFDIGRCIDGATYNDNYTEDSQRPDSLSQANDALKTHVYKISQPLRFIPCPRLGLYPDAVPDLAVSRLSDGMFPVTLTDQQAADWQAQVAQADMFDVKDEGTTQYDGKQVRKFSFAPKQGAKNTNKQLYDTFYRAAEIDKIKADHPQAWQYGFISINSGNFGDIRGFYLFDEQTSLPVYSELAGFNAGRSADSKTARTNVSRTKQTYEYPDKLTVTTNTPLAIIK